MIAHPGILGISYAVPVQSRSVRELAAQGALESDPALLERFGFGQVRVAVEETPYGLALAAATALLRDGEIDAGSVDALIYAGAPGAIAFAKPGDALARVRGLCDVERFEYPGTRLQFDLGLERATVLGLDQLACTSLFGAIRLARALCVAEGLERILCVSSEFSPASAGREAITNCTSDAACAVLIGRDATRLRIAGAASVTKGFFWGGGALRDEVMASYFPTAAHVMRATIADAGWEPDSVNWIIPHNVSATSWNILTRLAAMPNARFWSDNIARLGHTLAGDNFINLRDALDAGAIRSGDRLLLFSYGYGAHWSGLALEA